MTYIKKEFRRILDIADKEFIIPECFKKFIKEKALNHNLIIKFKKNKCYCTNCNNEFILNCKINSKIKCPICHQKLLVKTDRLQSYSFHDNLQLLDKVEDTFILRTFELYSNYNDKKIKNYVTEFMRTIIKNNGQFYEFVGNNVNNHMGYMYVSHYLKNDKWRPRNYRWAYHDVLGLVCPYNLKALIKDTKLQYSQLDKFVSKMDYIDFIDIFTNKASYPLFELLVKAKLYNLALDVKKFGMIKSFKDIKGMSKSYYTFMKKHNINYQQFKVLQLLKKENIRLINALTKYNNLEELVNYVDLEKAYKLVLSKTNRENEYLDYLEMSAKLGYDMKDSKILYPKNLMQSHDKVQELMEIVENELNDKLIKERLKKLNKYKYQNKKYIVFPATSVEDLINESKQQINCVKTYCSKYADGKCDIYFMRELSNIDKSLVTIEVRNGAVVQSRIKRNNNPTKEQQKFINQWERKVLLPLGN